MISPAPHLPWQAATAVDIIQETPRVRSLRFEISTWAGHLPGQHVDVRLTAEDGYQAQRSYSIASAASSSSRIELTVEHIIDGEVSPYLTQELRPRDTIEIRGPIGGYFVWNETNTAPLVLIGAGSGIVPLMSILRTRDRIRTPVPASLIYSSRRDSDIIYRNELDHLLSKRDGLVITHTLTRGVPDGWRGESRRVDREMLLAHSFAPEQTPQIYICGPSSFVETVADTLVALGHAPVSVKTERFGPTNSSR